MSVNAIVQLVSKGVQDSVLTFNPTKTLFKDRYQQISNFSSEYFKVTFNSTFDYGKIVNAEVVRSGDLVTTMYLHLKVAALDKTATDFSADSYFTNEYVYALAKRIELQVGGTTIDRHTGLQLAIMEEVETAPGQEMGYAIGKSGSVSELRTWSTFQQEFFMPLQFWFNRERGSALPLIALQYHETNIELETRSFGDLLVDVTNASSKTASNSQGGILTGQMIVNYIFLDEFERNLWTANEHDYLVDIWKQQTFSSSTGTSGTSTIDLSQRLSFGLPIKELLFVVQPRSRNSTPGSNDFFNFEALSTGPANPQKHPIETADLQLNNTGFQYKYSATFAHVVTNKEVHTRIPRKHIYCIPFARFPEDGIQPSGSVNFSRIDNIELVLTIDSSMNVAIDAFVFGRGLNVAHISKGMLSVRYSG